MYHRGSPAPIGLHERYSRAGPLSCGVRREGNAGTLPQKRGQGRRKKGRKTMLTRESPVRTGLPERDSSEFRRQTRARMPPWEETTRLCRTPPSTIGHRLGGSHCNRKGSKGGLTRDSPVRTGLPQGHRVKTRNKSTRKGESIRLCRWFGVGLGRSVETHQENCRIGHPP